MSLEPQTDSEEQEDVETLIDSLLRDVDRIGGRPYKDFDLRAKAGLACRKLNGRLKDHENENVKYDNEDGNEEDVYNDYLEVRDQADKWVKDEEIEEKLETGEDALDRHLIPVYGEEIEAEKNYEELDAREKGKLFKEIANGETELESPFKRDDYTLEEIAEMAEDSYFDLEKSGETQSPEEDSIAGNNLIRELGYSVTIRDEDKEIDGKTYTDRDVPEPVNMDRRTLGIN